jgi:1-carboxybiuret hydrolase
MSFFGSDSIALAAAVRQREASATSFVEAALARIRALDPQINAFTEVTEARARAEARRVDAIVAQGRDPGPLAGVPFAVKNLFDIAGLPTLAGSKIRRSAAPAARDAALVRRLTQAGAVLVGALNMDEFAYGFTTENSHYGPVRNPHDPERTAGGSSGGSGAAVAAGMVPFTLGSDTGGSIRVPSSLCGLFGLKPTYGRVSRAGSVLFAPSFDVVGPLGRSVRDLALLCDLLQGPDSEDPVCSAAPGSPVSRELTRGASNLRLAVAGGYFKRYATPEAEEVITRVAHHLAIGDTIELPDPRVARSAAFVIGAAEGASMHDVDLRHRLEDFDPNTRYRFLAGALLPADWYVKAQRYRRWFNDRLAEIFTRFDAILTPATPFSAIRLGQERVILGGEELMARPSVGLFTQPFSLIGVPIVVVPLRGSSGLPLGVQIVAAHHREDLALRIAHQLERDGIAQALTKA